VQDGLQRVVASSMWICTTAAAARLHVLLSCNDCRCCCCCCCCARLTTCVNYSLLAQACWPGMHTPVTYGRSALVAVVCNRSGCCSCCKVNALLIHTARQPLLLLCTAAAAGAAAADCTVPEPSISPSNSLIACSRVFVVKSPCNA
jgi:hypothetical protein